MTSHNHNHVARVARRLTVVVGVGALTTVSGIGTAMATTTPPDDSAAGSVPTDTAAPAEPTAIAITLTESSIEGLPTDLVAGLVDITLTDETEAAGEEISFTLVEPGTDVETFKAGLAPLFEGGPFPDFFLNNVGASAHTITTLDAGEYIAWIDLAANLDRPSTVDDIIAVPLTVGEGDNDAVIPPTDGSIRAGDYLFDADVSAGGTTVTFTNSSDNQFHHVTIVDFGTNDPAVVEESLLPLLESEEDAPLPEDIDGSQINFDFAVSPVFGPGSGGTFEAPFEEGHTYAALCFIQDRESGLPHAIQHQMYDVFVVDAS